MKKTQTKVEEIDKPRIHAKRHYGKYDAGVKSNQSLYRNIVARSLNIAPDPDVDVDNRRTYGMTWQHLLATAALVSAVGGVGMGAGVLLGLKDSVPTPPVVAPPVVTVPDVAAKVRLYWTDPETGEEFDIPGAVINKKTEGETNEK